MPISRKFSFRGNTVKPPVPNFLSSPHRCVPDSLTQSHITGYIVSLASSTHVSDIYLEGAPKFHFKRSFGIIKHKSHITPHIYFGDISPLNHLHTKGLSRSRYNKLRTKQKKAQQVSREEDILQAHIVSVLDRIESQHQVTPSQVQLHQKKSFQTNRIMTSNGWPAIDATAVSASSDLFGGDLFGDELMDMYNSSAVPGGHDTNIESIGGEYCTALIVFECLLSSGSFSIVGAAGSRWV